MQVNPSYSSNTCSHDVTVLEFLRTGKHLHTVAWILLRCVKCLVELDRVRLTRSEREAVNREKTARS